ncbi:MAG TPA: rhodanese-like domain-containing protein [Gemmatimonadota bacterium]|nr:rhodanese-like domain-containing protein [Gemmatimonadota bacterium]
MLFERIEDPGLSQYSYVVGCSKVGRVAVVDPRRDIDVYLDYASRRDLAITHVLETHIHADFASGARALAERTGAQTALSSYDAGERYEISFPHRELTEGDRIEIGSVRMEPLHTPGHTPEHLSFLVYDETESKDVPRVLLSGDFLFVGSLGRPDLLGEDAKRELAHRLFGSVQEKLAGLSDEVEVHPGHGAGSMCGAGMSARPSSTIGAERAGNPYLDPELSEEGFVDRILGSAPPFPPYYRRMKELNAAGAPPVARLPGGSGIPAPEFRARAEEGWSVIDVRDTGAFGAGHVPNSFGIGLGRNLSTWAAWVVPYDTPILLVAPDPAAVESAARALVRVGLDDIRGHLAGGITAWREAGFPLSVLPQITVEELHDRIERGQGPPVLDVRGDGEWAAGHVESATHIMGGTLMDRLDEVPVDGTGVAVICGSGYRSNVAASVLERAGFERLFTVPGGMGAWKAARLPFTTD